MTMTLAVGECEDHVMLTVGFWFELPRRHPVTWPNVLHIVTPFQMRRRHSPQSIRVGNYEVRNFDETEVAVVLASSCKLKTSSKPSNSLGPINDGLLATSTDAAAGRKVPELPTNTTGLAGIMARCHESSKREDKEA